MAKKLNNPKWWNAIEAYCANPSISMPKLSEIVSVHQDTLYKWFKKEEFLKALWKRHLALRTLNLIDVYDKQVEEANNGSTKAAEFVYKQHGELEKKMEGIQSPFMQFNQINNITTTEEVQNPMVEVQNKVHDKVHTEVHEIPVQPIPVKEKKPTVYIQKVNKEKRNALMKLKRRAKKVGLTPLGSGRPTKTQKVLWLERLEEMEKEQGIKPPSP
jgi:hypothetical protein